MSDERNHQSPYVSFEQFEGMQARLESLERKVDALMDRIAEEENASERIRRFALHATIETQTRLIRLQLENLKRDNPESASMLGSFHDALREIRALYIGQSTAGRKPDDILTDWRNACQQLIERWRITVDMS